MVCVVEVESGSHQQRRSSVIRTRVLGDACAAQQHLHGKSLIPKGETHREPVFRSPVFRAYKMRSAHCWEGTPPFSFRHSI
jgi:hypothetical protein